MTNKEEIFDAIQNHPEGLDDDDITTLTGVKPRQQVQQICNQLASADRIRRISINKIGKRRKIHNFPVKGEAGLDIQARNWRRRLFALVAATGRTESSLLEEAVHLLAMQVLQSEVAKSL